MKKLIVQLLALLLVVYAVLTMVNMGSRYNQERRLWHIEREFVEVAKHQESASVYNIDKLAGKFNDFIGEHPKTASAVRAQILLGNVYMLKKDYARGRAELQKVATIDPSNSEQIAQSQALIAKSYMVEDDWKNAERVYKSLIKNYPMTGAGFVAPV
jgi:tetratricopeptide (TPR) repeat protein